MLNKVNHSLGTLFLNIKLHPVIRCRQPSLGYTPAFQTGAKRYFPERPSSREMVEKIEEVFKVKAGFVGLVSVTTSSAPIPKTASLRVAAATDYGHVLGFGSLGKSCSRVLNGS